MEKRKFQVGALTAISLLLLGVAITAFRLGAVANAQVGQGAAQTAVSGETSMLLQYQGRLSDPASGAAVPDGSYIMTLRLYSTAAGGTPLWSEVKDVPVQDGLFSTVLGDTAALSHDLFDGRALWLGIKVGADAEAKPRQQVLPVAYALSLVPGASVHADSGGAALQLSNAGSGQALHADGAVFVEGDLTVDGTLSGTINDPGLVTQYEFDDHIYGGMHSNRALAYGSINEDGSIASATSNVSSQWNNLWKCYEITIDGHTYEWHTYVTIVTPVVGGFTSAWSNDGKLCVGIYDPQTQVIKGPFQFVTFQP